MCAGFFSLVACKETSVVKPDLVPPVDNINTFRLSAADFAIEIKNGYFDSLRTDDDTYPIAPVGSILSDPFFGGTDAGIYFQVAPNVDNFSFPADMTTIDSAVLVLPYTSASYGDTANTNYQSLKVYRITQGDFKVDTNTKQYYAFSEISVDMGNPLGAGRVSAQSIKYDSTSYPGSGADTVGAQLRIRLSDAFAGEIKGLSPDVFKNFSSFIDYFKGVYVASDPAAPAADRTRISYFYLGVSSSDLYRRARIEFWYRLSDGTPKIAMFTYNPVSSAFFASVKRNRTGTPSEAFYSTAGSARDSILVQGAPGFYTDLTIKNIQDIPASIINKAELQITALKLGNDDQLTTPLQILPQGLDSNGHTYNIADLLDINGGGGQTSNSQGFVGGTPKDVVIDGVTYKQYSFNIPRELQQARMAGKTELKIRLTASAVLPGAYRLVAPGPRVPGALQMKFDVIYSKLN